MINKNSKGQKLTKNNSQKGFLWLVLAKCKLKVLFTLLIHQWGTWSTASTWRTFLERKNPKRESGKISSLKQSKNFKLLTISSTEDKSICSWPNLTAINLKNFKESKNSSRQTLITWTQSTKLMNSKKSSCHFVLSCPRMKMSNPVFTWEIWTLFLCKTIQTIVWYMSTTRLLIRLDNMWKAIFSAGTFLYKKSKSSQTKTTGNLLTTFTTQ